MTAPNTQKTDDVVPWGPLETPTQEIDPATGKQPPMAAPETKI